MSTAEADLIDRLRATLGPQAVLSGADLPARNQQDWSSGQ